MVVKKYNPAKQNVKSFKSANLTLSGLGAQDYNSGIQSGPAATEEHTSLLSWPSCLCFAPECAPNAHLLLRPASLARPGP